MLGTAIIGRVRIAYWKCKLRHMCEYRKDEFIWINPNKLWMTCHCITAHISRYLRHYNAHIRELQASHLAFCSRLLASGVYPTLLQMCAYTPSAQQWWEPGLLPWLHPFNHSSAWCLITGATVITPSALRLQIPCKAQVFWLAHCWEDSWWMSLDSQRRVYSRAYFYLPTFLTNFF